MPVRYDLEKVKLYAKQALDDPSTEVVFFSSPSRSIDLVIEEFLTKGKPMDLLQAKIYILESILGLESKDFWKVQSQWQDVFADWYGIA